MQSQQDEFRFITLTLTQSNDYRRAAQHILAVADKELCNESAETEYTERDGILCINRVIEDEALNQKVFPDPKDADHVHLSIANVGLLDKLYYLGMSSSLPRLHRSNPMRSRLRSKLQVSTFATFSQHMVKPLVHTSALNVHVSLFE